MVECPFCSNKSESFLPFGRPSEALYRLKVTGTGYRLNTQCPDCGSIDRDRLVYLYLKNKTEIFTEEARLLHVVPEAPLKKVLEKCKNIDYIPVSIYADSVYPQINLYDIGFDDNSFDIIICNHILMYFENDALAMKELYRILKPGGWALLQVPIGMALKKTYEDKNITNPLMRHYAYGQSDYVRVYARDYKIRLLTRGFDVGVYSPEKELGASEVEKYALNPFENIYIASKK